MSQDRNHAEKNKGLNRIIKATGFSLNGLISTFKTEAAFRQEVVMAVILIPLALWLDISSVETALLIASILIVLIVEILNSSIEAVVDRIGSEFHELSGKAKDAASAAVFLSLTLMVIIWGIIIT